MNIIEIKTTSGKKAMVSSEELHRSIISWLRENAPSNQVILAEETNNEGQLATTPVAAMFLLKNPHDVVYFTDTVTIEKTEL